METFSALLTICAGNSPVLGEFPAQRPVMRSYDVFFDLRLNKRLSKQSLGWWFETLSRPLWRHRNAYLEIKICSSITSSGVIKSFWFLLDWAIGEGHRPVHSLLPQPKKQWRGLSLQNGGNPSGHAHEPTMHFSVLPIHCKWGFLRYIFVYSHKICR